MKIKLILLASLFAVGFAMSATAGSVADADSDGVPDVFDNCLNVANGMNETSNQVDTDQDGFGNACDADYDNSGAVNTVDFGPFLSAFGAGAGAAQDHNGDGVVNTIDFGVFLSQFNQGVPGPSGLSCAGAVPCSP